MNLNEVNKLFIKYQDEKHQFLQNTQQYFLNNKIQPYVWIDENHRLRIKHKFRRGKTAIEIADEMKTFKKVVQDFADENDLLIRFSHILEETDYYLPGDRQSQWSAEYIIEVKK